MMKPPLSETVKQLGEEIRRLKRRDRPARFGSLSLHELRRRLSFYCHPDRGGDPRVMQSINVLFDYLDEAACPQKP
jgi:hypothetical protein